MAKGKQVVVAKKNEVMDWNAMLKASASKTKQAAAVLGTVSKYVSFKGGTLSVGGASLNPAWMHCIVLATLNERAWYEGAYDPNTPRSPQCFAYGEVDGELPEAPHADSPDPQSDSCQSCPHAEWGSAGEGKRGQACKQSFDLMLVKVSDKPTVQEIEKAKVYGARIPASSLKFAKAWMDYVGAQDSAVFAWKTLLEVKPGTPFTVHLSPQEELDPKLRPAVMAKLEEARRDIIVPYQPIEEEAPKAKPAAKRFGK